MDEEKNPIRSVSQLSIFTYYVPAYQRGYRWTDKEVTDLLEDISTFVPKEVPGTNEKTWYCLQPLVVKKTKDGAFEVIDGQQRLTTIHLIGRYINERWRGRDKDPELTLTYESRKETETFFERLRVSENDKVQIDGTYIDFYHISVAYGTIAEWVRNQKSFNRDAFINTFLHHVKMIWYEPFETDSITIFTRINTGKIPLTNAELIKALFLNRSNFTSSVPNPSEEDKIRLEQIKIASEWDRMEATLHNEDFWLFLNDKDTKSVTRIDFIFNILTKMTSSNDDYELFRIYSVGFKNCTSKEIEQKWSSVKRCFQTLEEWFCDRDLYHKIGFLLSTGTNILSLFEMADKKRKSEFVKDLNKEIADCVPHDIDSLEYKDARVKRVLLLHNIQTMLNNTEEQSRFPFDRYKTESWDVEHIHSVNEKMPKTETHQRDWLTDSIRYVSDESLIVRAKEQLAKKPWAPELFVKLASDILVSYAQGERPPDINDIDNLALLDARTNRGYGNAVFPEKRKTIIEREKQGTFIPVCTKNVFMKFYSKKIENFTFWSEPDRKAYLCDIKDVLHLHEAAKQGC